MRKQKPPEWPRWYEVAAILLASYGIGWLLWDINETLRDLEGWWK